MTENDITKLAAELTKQLVDKGQLIEAGWASLKLMAIPESAPQTQLDCMREAFFAGAHHTFASVMTLLDPGQEPTQRDLNRISMIHSELEEFIQQFRATHGMLGGRDKKESAS